MVPRAVLVAFLYGCSAEPPPAPRLDIAPRDADEARELVRRCGLCDVAACRTIADYFDATKRRKTANHYAGRACGCARCAEDAPELRAYCLERSACR